MIYYTDGGCVPNPGKGGWGFVVLKDGLRIDELSGSQESTTNNRMELTAIIKALDYARVVGDKDITIISDSQLCINTCSKWIFGWRSKGIMNKKKNPDLLLEVLPLLYSLKPRFEWVRGHNGNRWNEYVDQLCMKEITK